MRSVAAALPLRDGWGLDRCWKGLGYWMIAQRPDPMQTCWEEARRKERAGCWLWRCSGR